MATSSHQPTSVLDALGFYGHNVILPAVAGLHFGQQLTAALGIAAATALAAFAAAAVIACVLVRSGASVRVFAVTTLVLSLVLTLTPVFVHGAVADAEVTRHALWAAGSRYAQVPILLLDSLVIVAIDAYLRRGGVPFQRATHGTAVLLLVAVLGIAWVSDFRYTDLRSHATPWTQIVGRIGRACQQHPLSSVVYPASCAHTLLSGETLNTLWPAHICHTSHRPRHRNDQGSPASRSASAGTSWLGHSWRLYQRLMSWLVLRGAVIVMPSSTVIW